MGGNEIEGGRGVRQRDTGLLSIFRVFKNITKGQHVPGNSFLWHGQEAQSSRL